MKILIQSPRIVNTASPFHLKKKNVLIANGRIAEIGDKNFQADKTINGEGMYLSAGWFDLGAFVGDPGLEQREDLHDALTRCLAQTLHDFPMPIQMLERRRNW